MRTDTSWRKHPVSRLLHYLQPAKIVLFFCVLLLLHVCFVWIPSTAPPLTPASPEVRLLLQARKEEGRRACNAHPGGHFVTPSGTWCLEPDPNQDWGIYGRAAKYHVRADFGIGSTIIKYLTPKYHSLIDIGAGVGQYGYYFRLHAPDLEWFGYDGAENVEDFTDGMVKWLDVTEPLFDTLDTFRAQWVMCLEVGEHIPTDKTDILLDLLDRHTIDGIIMSWAVPGQGGHSHINERTNEDIKKRMSDRGFIQTPWALEFQQAAREAAEYNWFKQTLLVFIRKNHDQ